MSLEESLCQPQRIALFLRQELSDVEQDEFETHLGHCHECRRVLELETARAEVWATVRESLSSNELPFENPDFRGGSAASGFGGMLGGDEAVQRFETVLGFLSPTDDPRMLGRLGAYEIVGIVGHGGMGVVLKGLDPALSRYVAIKVLSPHLAASGSARRRFAREAQAAAAVTHENVVAIHGVAEWNGLPYLVMPYVRGESLQKRLDQHGPLGLNEVLRVGRQVAAGLAAAHSQGLVHRDIKPANILLEDGVERLQITDFGLARAVDDASLTRTGVIAGTPQYMSPEQARGEVIDARSDLFSLGSTLYALCTGRPPFRAETSYGILRRITDNHPRPIREINPDLPDWLATIISKLLAKDPASRFSDAAEVAAILEQCLAHVRQPTVLPLPPQVTSLQCPDTQPTGVTWRRTWIRWRRPQPVWMRGLVVGLLLCCVTVLGMFIRPKFWGQAPPRPSENTQLIKTFSGRADSESSAATDWNAPLRAVSDLARDEKVLESEAERVWDTEPVKPPEDVDAEEPVGPIEMQDKPETY